MKNKKARNGIGILIILLIVGAILIYFFILKQPEITGSETMTRTGPTSVNPSSTFQVAYTAIGTSGLWGATIMENIAGGCTIDGKTSLKFVMLSDLPNPLIYTVQAPSSGSCTFTGDYQFGNSSIIKFKDIIVQIQ